MGIKIANIKIVVKHTGNILVLYRLDSQFIFKSALEYFWPAISLQAKNSMELSNTPGETNRKNERHMLFIMEFIL